MTGVILYYMIFAIGAGLLGLGCNYKRKYNIYSVIGLLVIILFAAGRYHVGTDTSLYITIFQRYAEADWSTLFRSNTLEFLFCAISKISYMLGGRVLTLGCFAALTVIPMYSAIYRESEDFSYGIAAFCFLLFFFAYSFNILRQYVAVAIIFWGMQFIYENKLFKYLICVVVAIGFHSSAIIGIVLWFLWDHRNGDSIVGWKRTLIVLVTAGVSIAYVPVVNFLTSNDGLISSYSDFIGKTAGTNRDFYLYLFELVVFMFFKSALVEINKKNDFAFTLLWISVLIGLTGFSNPQIKRMALYFSVPAKTILFGYFPAVFKNNQIILKLIIIMYACVQFLVVAGLFRQADLLPYQFNLTSPW